MKTPNRSSAEGVFGVLVAILKVVVKNEAKKLHFSTATFFIWV